MTGDHLVHGLGQDLVGPDWPPLTDAEVARVLARVPSAAGRGERPRIRWRSPRPFSAAALVDTGAEAGVVAVKRHHRAVRTAAALAPEHAFAAHLRAGGVDVPAVLRTVDGAGAWEDGEWTYEVHEHGRGVDAYRDAPSWTPPRHPGHARAAGAALARLHAAAHGFDAPARPEHLLVSRWRAFAGPEDPLAALAEAIDSRPALAAYLKDTGRDWRADVTRHLLPAHRRLAPYLGRLEPLWAHGDWHPSNLLWTGTGPDAEVNAVLDFGLADRATPVFDLATALERSCVSWLEAAPVARLDLVDALVDGYTSVRRLTPAEAGALAEIMPVVHAEFALSEVEYFAAVVGSRANADAAYDGYLLGHAAWFATPPGVALLERLRRRAG